MRNDEAGNTLYNETGQQAAKTFAQICQKPEINDHDMPHSQRRQRDSECWPMSPWSCFVAINMWALTVMGSVACILGGTSLFADVPGLRLLGRPIVAVWEKLAYTALTGTLATMGFIYLFRMARVSNVAVLLIVMTGVSLVLGLRGSQAPEWIALWFVLLPFLLLWLLVGHRRQINEHSKNEGHKKG